MRGVFLAAAPSADLPRSAGKRLGPSDYCYLNPAMPLRAIAPVNSMRLLVVEASPPKSSFSCAPKHRIAPHPPGPGLPEQAPSVQIETSPFIAANRAHGRCRFVDESTICRHIRAGPLGAPRHPPVHSTNRLGGSGRNAAPHLAPG